ncbi:hypothetical protein [Pandoravirus japonicus]|uniref:Uncharacterized protein n=1 Tax=Pandoravirus japonicus TaxID=2823154 RepID=A0A811BTS8_9VIRU|nr:hypothetical protein [Pandoravirus japonicus]
MGPARLGAPLVHAVGHGEKKKIKREAKIRSDSRARAAFRSGDGAAVDRHRAGSPPPARAPVPSLSFFLPTFSDDQRASSEGPPAAFRERALLL